uniref:Uncharacterized protein n=1 Tax=Timema cristinae TaxID=61476 RepID=A0A7R9D7H7_TIMCR|nr:unnamed protein product [Timema cristinae]
MTSLTENDIVSQDDDGAYRVLLGVLVIVHLVRVVVILFQYLGHHTMSPRLPERLEWPEILCSFMWYIHSSVQGPGVRGARFSRFPWRWLTCKLASSCWKWGKGRDPPELVGTGGSPKESNKWGGEVAGSAAAAPPTAAGRMEGLVSSSCVQRERERKTAHLYKRLQCLGHLGPHALELRNLPWLSMFGSSRPACSGTLLVFCRSISSELRNSPGRGFTDNIKILFHSPSLLMSSDRMKPRSGD